MRNGFRITGKTTNDRAGHKVKAAPALSEPARPAYSVSSSVVAMRMHEPTREAAVSAFAKTWRHE